MYAPSAARGPACAVPPVEPARPTAAAVDQALLTAWQKADKGDLPAAAHQAQLAVKTAMVAGAPALSDRQRAMLDLLEGSALLHQGEFEPGLERFGSALAWFAPPEALLQGGPASRAHWLPSALARTTPAWACTALGRALGRMGDPARGLAWVACAAALSDHLGLSASRLLARAEQARLLAQLDQHLPAIQLLQNAVSLASKSATRALQADLLNQLAALWMARANSPTHRDTAETGPHAARQALACADRALLAAQTGHIAQARSQALVLRAEARLMLGQWTPAKSDLAAARAVVNTAPGTAALLLRVEALLMAALGAPDTARQLLDQALNDDNGGPDPQERKRLLTQGLALETQHGHVASRPHWVALLQSHAEQGYQRRLVASALCARWLGAADLGSTGVPQDPMVVNWR